MEKEVPKKFNSLLSPEKKPATVKKDVKEVKLEKREVLETAEKDSKTVKTADDKKEGDKEKSILDRVKPRPNKKVKETTKSNKKPEEPAPEDPDAKPERTKRDPAKTRCNFWPTCKNEDCPFVHPAEPVI